ncbi:hypothetical protein F66182_3499 [Fusarium sp. NRRL 66182]|nr:hypothetical protein F66182_3499 [Fusarium sp. NRRL 66182]
MARLHSLPAALFIWATQTIARSQPPAIAQSQPAAIGQITPHGCFLTRSSTVGWGHSIETKREAPSCVKLCIKHGKAVVMVGGNRCYCGDTYPNDLYRLDDESCDLSCLSQDKSKCIDDPGLSTYDSDHDRYFSVYNTGLAVDVKQDERLHPSTQVLKQHRPVACYGELPKEIKQGQIASNSPTSCYRRCERMGGRIIIMQNDTCYCTDSFPEAQSLLSDANCNFKCPGSSFFQCGGRGAYSVYDLAPPNPQPQVTEQLMLDEYEGRYKEFPSSSNHMRLGKDAKSNFHEACIAECTSQGEPVALMHGSRCYCASTNPRFKAVIDDHFCQMPCAGNSSLSCGGDYGGDYAFSAYNTGLLASVEFEGGMPDASRNAKGDEFIRGYNRVKRFLRTHSCYKTPPPEASYGRYEVRNTMATCFNFCKAKRKPIAAARRQNCLCADAYPGTEARVSPKECDSPWLQPNEDMDRVGLLDGWGVVETGMGVARNGTEDLANTPSEPQKMKPYGCFNLQPSSLPQPANVTRREQGDSCTFQCAADGYRVAMRHDSKCYCGHAHPDASQRIDDSKCWYTCLRDAREMCGGPLAVTVYDTKMKSVGHKTGSESSTSPLTKPWQCPHPALERVMDGSWWVVDNVVSSAGKAHRAFTSFLDKAQDVFDACLYRVMVAMTDAMFRMGLMSAEEARDTDL